MLNTLLKPCISFLAIIGVAKVNAQEAATATGGDGLGSGGSVAYSIGQVVYATNVDASGSTAQGVQQPYANIVTGINDLDLGITLSVFP
ncbi:MAG TPA: hypothetical protein VFN30_09205, partial [Chitinophagaceae bacterium]|nr:hypothetical protein [Chitinophagaceae bacterium]